RADPSSFPTRRSADLELVDRGGPEQVALTGRDPAEDRVLVLGEGDDPLVGAGQRRAVGRLHELAEQRVLGEDDALALAELADDVRTPYTISLGGVSTPHIARMPSAPRAS